MPPSARSQNSSLASPGVMKDCLIASALTFLLALPILGVKSVPAIGGLDLQGRIWAPFVAAAIVFTGRLFLHIVWWRRRTDLGLSEKIQGSAFAAFFKKHQKTALPAAIILAIIFPFLPTTDRYLLDLSILILTYVMLGWGLNIVVGLAGLLDLGYVAFYAVGAYSYALIATTFGWSFWVCLPLAGLFAAFFGVILGFPVLRLRGDYLAIVTLAFGEIIRVVLLNWYQFTGGPDGISGIPRPSFFGLPFKRFGEGTFHEFFGMEFSSLHRIMFLYFVILTMALITNFISIRLRKLPIGRAWEALREDEIACRSLGINTTNTKLTAFAIGAMFGGFAGAFFATRQGFISPESFVFMESALILAIVVLGGMGSQFGVVIASIVMIGGFELFRNLDFLKAIFGDEFDPATYRMLVFGMAMVLIMIWRPRGLIASRAPSIFLKEKKSVAADLVAEGKG